MVLKFYSCGRQKFFDTVDLGTQVLFYNVGIMSVWDNFYRRVFLCTLPETHIFLLNDITNCNWVTKASRSKIVQAAIQNSKATDEGLERRWNNHERVIAKNFYPSIRSVFPLSTDIEALQGFSKSNFLFLKFVLDIIHVQIHLCQLQRVTSHS